MLKKKKSYVHTWLWMVIFGWCTWHDCFLLTFSSLHHLLENINMSEAGEVAGGGSLTHLVILDIKTGNCSLQIQRPIFCRWSWYFLLGEIWDFSKYLLCPKLLPTWKPTLHLEMITRMWEHLSQGEYNFDFPSLVPSSSDDLLSGRRTAPVIWASDTVLGGGA